MNDYFLRLIELPFSIKGLTTLNDDGSYNIYINSLISDEQQRKAYEHELEHIDNDDLYSPMPAHIIERNMK